MTNSPIRAINFIRNFIISMHVRIYEPTFLRFSYDYFLHNLQTYSGYEIIFDFICTLLDGICTLLFKCYSGQTSYCFCANVYDAALLG